MFSAALRIAASPEERYNINTTMEKERYELEQRLADDQQLTKDWAQGKNKTGRCKICGNRTDNVVCEGIYCMEYMTRTLPAAWGWDT